MEPSLKPNVWTRGFSRLCVGNLLFYAALYMLVPVLPFYVKERFGVSLTLAGVAVGIFSFAIFPGGPFNSYLADRYSRKNLYLFATVVVVAAMAGYLFTGTLTWVFLLRLLQGFFFGIAAAAGITLAIDVTHTSCRSRGNSFFTRAGRLGMLLGPVAGILLYKYYSLDAVIYGAIAAGSLGVIEMMRVNTLFRAPIGVAVCSLDRFILPRAILPALNVMFVSLFMGLLFSLFGIPGNREIIATHFMWIFSAMALGILVAITAERFLFGKERVTLQVVAGLISVLLSILILASWRQEPVLIGTSLILGAGLSLAASALLNICIGLSDHCQRSTANSTYVLAWESGIGIGLILGCYLIDRAGVEGVVCSSFITIFIALIYYCFITRRLYFSA
ncbi:MAG: MFS transporter [Bacteroides sp.]|nr:MFS transporter [Bacteroides sp.]